CESALLTPGLPSSPTRRSSDPFPPDFICEGVDQTRGWFYSLLAIGVTAFDALVYKNVIVNELVLDAQGQKMSSTSSFTITFLYKIGRAHVLTAVTCSYAIPSSA